MSSTSCFGSTWRARACIGALGCTLVFAQIARAQDAAAAHPAGAEAAAHPAAAEAAAHPAAAEAAAHPAAAATAGPEAGASAGPASAEPGPAQRYVEARRVDRLEASLAEHANADSLVRSWGGAGALVLGGALIAGGILVAVEDEGWGTRGRAAVSGAAWAAGASLIAIAIYRWTSTTPAEDRFARWNQLRSTGKLDLFEFARFEGELASEAEQAGFNRGLSAFGSFGLVAGGGGLIALGASGELGDDTSTDSYILGGVMAGVGVIQAITLFWQRTPAERAWKHYSEGGAGFFSDLRLRPLL